MHLCTICTTILDCTLKNKEAQNRGSDYVKLEPRSQVLDNTLKKDDTFISAERSLQSPVIHKVLPMNSFGGQALLSP